MHWDFAEGADHTLSHSPPILQLAVFEFENFRGKKVELSGECKDVLEKTQRIGSVIVELGPYVMQFPFINSHQFYCICILFSSCFPCLGLMCAFTLYKCILSIFSDGWGLSVQVLQESSLCWRKESTLAGAPGPTA